MNTRVARLAPYCVSSGTLRPEDLYDAFMAELEACEPFLASRMRREHEAHLEEAREALGGHETFPGEAEEAEAQVLDWNLEEAVEALEALASEGFYFGACEGDGACFGFWPCEEESG